MIHLLLISKKLTWVPLSVLVLAACLSFDRAAEAGLTLQSSSGSVTYSVYNTAPGSGTGTFSDGSGNIPANQLIYPGGGLPALTTLAANNTTQTDTATTLAPYFLSTATNTSSEFGSAKTEVYTANSGQQGSYTTQGGIFWSLKTSLADSLPANSSLASVSFSIATADYQNLTSSNITINPGAVLSIVGNLGSSSSYVAAALSTSITVTDGESTTTTALDPIILASGGGVNIANKGNYPNEYASVTVNGTKVTGTGTSLSAPITLPPYESVIVTSYLTLISDPGSEIGIANNLPNDVSVVPDFGTFASSPSAIVPEPATIALLGIGLGMVGLVGRTSRRRTSPNA